MLDESCATSFGLHEVAPLLKELDNFVITGHVSPDGDCISSQLGLQAALRAVGKQAICVSASDDPIPDNLMFLPGVTDIVPASLYEGSAETFIAVDVSDLKRMGDSAALFDKAKVRIILDHHPHDEMLTSFDYTDPNSASTSLIVWEVVKDLCAQPPYQCALCSYTGLVTDTGGFRFQNATAEAFTAASELIAAGIDPSKVATAIFQNKSLASLLLQKIAIEHMELFHNDKASISYLTHEDMTSCNATKNDTEPIIDVLRSLKGVRVVCTLREQEGSVRGSLRSKDDTDVAQLARSLGGGGHKAAAGFTLFMPIMEAKEFMKERIDALLNN